MMIIERNQQKPTKRNISYGAEAFAWLQPKRALLRPETLLLDGF